MSGKLTKPAYKKLIDENVAWLRNQPNTLERQHIDAIIKRSVDYEYPKHDCGGDEIDAGVCEGMYADKCDDVMAMHEALKEVYALAGDVNGVKDIIETAIRNHAL